MHKPVMPHILPPSGRATKQQSAELDVASESDQRTTAPVPYLMPCPLCTSLHQAAAFN